MRAWVHGWLDIVELRPGLRLELVRVGLAGISLGGLPGASVGWGDLRLMWCPSFRCADIEIHALAILFKTFLDGSEDLLLVLQNL